jgi:hypothetical protein
MGTSAVIPDLRYKEQIGPNDHLVYAVDGGFIDNNGVMPAFSMRAPRIVYESISDLAMTNKNAPRNNAVDWNMYEYIEECYKVWTKPENLADGENRDITEQTELKKLLKSTITLDSYAMFDINFDGTLTKTRYNGMFKRRYHCAAVNELNRTNFNNLEPMIVSLALTVEPTPEAISFWGLAQDKASFQEYDVIFTMHIGAPVLGWEELVKNNGAGVDIAALNACGQHGHAGSGDTEGAASKNRAAIAAGGANMFGFFPHTTTQRKIPPACTEAVINMATYSYLRAQAHYDFSLSIDTFANKVQSGATDDKYAEVVDCRKSVTSTSDGLKKCLDGYKPLRPANYVAPSAIIDAGREPVNLDCTPMLAPDPFTLKYGNVKPDEVRNMILIIFGIGFGVPLGVLVGGLIRQKFCTCTPSE